MPEIENGWNLSNKSLSLSFLNGSYIDISKWRLFSKLLILGVRLLWFFSNLPKVLLHPIPYSSIAILCPNLKLFDRGNVCLNPLYSLNFDKSTDEIIAA